MFETYWMFEDKSEDLEFSKQGDAVTYRAWGLVTCIQYPEDREDGNVIGVIYRSPTGRLFRRWRQIQEIDLHPIEKEEWRRVYDLVLFAEDKGTAKGPRPIEIPAELESKLLH